MKTCDAMREDLGTVQEEVRGLKEGIKRRKKVFRFVYLKDLLFGFCKRSVTLLIILNPRGPFLK